ncbi:putative ABC transporter ATP-binding protein YbhF [Roseimaritima multifibrata]|uniref:Putative ABC transporter ATP-binding protein YbhF n=1 Tax=Roseimaritima multifibrata TaxID=1930274 RepID=A0A517MF00_9BACT|nr:ABC transporter ATP-binding protein [Roseimaritima multifibrata]QDS93461.1 putative ABC transporter ATP-binding protein YbhF [Roseimaritima multifibrata]
MTVGYHRLDAGGIRLQQLYRIFGRTVAVQDVSFHVPKGSVFGYIGPNGAGKTTSMRILATLDLPTYGDAFVDGFSVIHDPELVRRKLGFMPDAFGSYRDVSCWEYIDFFARAYGLIGRERQKRLEWVTDFTGIRGMQHKPISGLSKGMKQRLCLGRALVHDPAVLILDEPAAGLDPRARIELRNMIGTLGAEGKTILVSSHILTELAEMCDSIGIIEQGRLLATGSVEAIQEAQRKTRDIRLRVVSDPVAAEKWLTLHSDCQSISVAGDTLRFDFSGDEEAQADLVAALIQDGCRISEIHAHQKSLEDVFLHVTEGLVQ